MDLNLGGKRVIVAGGSKEKVLISHIVFTVVRSVATCKVRLVTSSRQGFVHPGGPRNRLRTAPVGRALNDEPLAVHDPAREGMLAAAHEGRGEPMQKALFPCLMLIVMATVMARQELPPPFPRTNATKLFDNDRLNVWDIVWPSGQPTVMHRHIYDQVGTSGTMRHLDRDSAEMLEITSGSPRALFFEIK